MLQFITKSPTVKQLHILKRLGCSKGAKHFMLKPV